MWWRRKPEADPSATAAEGARRAWYRRPRRVVLLVLLVTLVAVAIPFALAWRDRGAHEVDVEDVVEEYREETDGEEVEAAAPLVPPAGVYSYRAEGDEKLSLLDTNQRWGANVPAVVARTSAECWSLRFRFSTNHRQEYRFCADYDGLYDTGGLIFQSFDFVAFTIDDTNVMTCEPPVPVVLVEARPDDTVDAACEGRSKQRDTEYTSSGTNRFVGLEQVEVEGEDLDAYHYVNERVLAGSQDGTDTTDWWYSTETGMPLRHERNIRVTSPSPIGDVVYTETGSLVLTSLEPRT